MLTHYFCYYCNCCEVVVNIFILLLLLYFSILFFVRFTYMNRRAEAHKQTTKQVYKYISKQASAHIKFVHYSRKQEKERERKKESRELKYAAAT